MSIENQNASSSKFKNLNIQGGKDLGLIMSDGSAEIILASPGVKKKKKAV